MAQYTITLQDEGSYEEEFEIEAASAEAASAQAEEMAEDWITSGDWGQDQIDPNGWISDVIVAVYWTVTDEDDDEVDRGTSRFTMEAQDETHQRAVKQAGGDPDCEHQWSGEGHGGCDTNPGVWSLGGTTMAYRSHCTECGVRREEIQYGSQRNPDQGDCVRYYRSDEE